MKEKYLIRIEGEMEQSGEHDKVDLLTRGSFHKRGGNFFIRYHESEATGYEGNTTTVKVETGGGKVYMLRNGTMPSQLVIELGRRHVCHYDSGYGVLSLGVAADVIESHLTEAGGNLMFSYTLDSGEAQISHNRVTITVQEAN